MNTMIKRGLHLAALVAIGVIALSSGRFSVTADAASPTPIPVSSCTALGAGAYRLTTNITTSGTCFTVTSGTAFDLGSHTLTGDNTGYAITDGGSNAQNVIILNGTITNFGTGIGMYECCDNGSYGLTVDGINFTTNNGDGVFSDSCCNTFTNIKANSNVGNGINLPTGCCNTFANVQANNNHLEGLYAPGGCCQLADGVTANNNLANTGIEFDGGTSAVVSSVANGNHGYGIFVRGGYNSIEGSTASFNTNAGGEGEGIYSGLGGYNLIDHSTANSNDNDGIHVFDNNNLITNSTANSNFRDGIYLPNDGGHAVVRDVTGTNGSDGVFISCASNVSRLLSHNNGDSDLDLDTCGGDCTLLNNFAPNTISGCF